MEENKLIHANLKLSALILGILVLLLAVIVFTQCGQQKVVEKTTQEPGGTCQDGRQVGEQWSEACPEGGQKTWVCAEKGKPSKLVLDCQPTKDECLKTTFERDVRPVVVANCVSCHTGQSFENASVAKNYAEEWARRVELNTGDPRKMPKDRELLEKDKAVFSAWIKAGLPANDADCENLPKPSFGEGLSPIEARMILDAAKINKDDKIFVRWAIVSVYKGAAAKKALDKLLNSLNRVNQQIVKSSWTDESKDILRFDLRDFALTRADWLRIEAAEPLDFVSNTDNGKILRLLTATRKPYLHLENLIDTVTSKEGLFTDLVKLPAFFDELTDELGVNYDQDLKEGDAALLGMNESVIAKLKNRLISRHESRDGAFYVSYDIEPPRGVPERNLVRFPLLEETGSREAVFAFSAKEVLFHLPSGLMGSALYNARGELQEVAPLEVVQAPGIIPPAPEIQNPVSCLSCHATGFLPAVDQVRAAAIGPGSALNAEDIERVKQLYRPQNSWNALFKSDNQKIYAALAKLGLDPSEKDPINEVRDMYHLSYNVDKAASLFFLSVEKFKQCLADSNEGGGELSQLLTGGTVGFDQLREVIPTLFDDCRIGEERDNGQ